MGFFTSLSNSPSKTFTSNSSQCPSVRDKQGDAADFNLITAQQWH